MSSATAVRRTRTALAAPRRRSPRRTADVATGIAGIGLGVIVGIQLVTRTEVSGPGALLIELSRWTGMVGTYLSLVVIFLIARVPFVERNVGLDHMIAWHRRLGPIALMLIAAHVVLVTLGYAAAEATSYLGETWAFLTDFPWLLPATAGFALMLVAGITSWRTARRRMKYETWWVTHLYFYLAVALAFLHQLTLGQQFSSHPWARAIWIALYVLTFGPLLVYRVLVPLYVSLVRHDLRVHAVVRENSSTLSVWIRGRNLDRLRAEGGQFFGWRFLTRDRWWQSHPYSLSAGPDPRYLRITVKDLGDHSRGLAAVRPGTRVVAEGPYGIFTAGSRFTDRVVLVAGGVGVAPIRALLDELPRHVAVDVLYRAPREEALVLREELEQIARSRPGIRLRYLVGSRHDYPINARTLLHLVPDVQRRDVYSCGPQPLVEAVREACDVLGLPEERVHDEGFSFQSPDYYTFSRMRKGASR